MEATVKLLSAFLKLAPVTAPVNVAAPPLNICAVVVLPSLIISALVAPEFAMVTVPVDLMLPVGARVTASAVVSEVLRSVPTLTVPSPLTAKNSVVSAAATIQIPVASTEV